MTKAEFILAIKKMISLYRASMLDEEIASWYERFKDVKFDVLIKTIENLESDRMPNAIELKKLCKEESEKQKYSILERMWNAGYFKRGIYGDLSVEQQERNYDKAVRWLDNGVIPQWFKDDMKEFELKQLSSIEQKKIGANNGREDLQLPHH